MTQKEHYLADLAKEAVRSAIGGNGKIRKSIGNAAGSLVHFGIAGITDELSAKTRALLKKAGESGVSLLIKKGILQPDGSIQIKIPFLKTVEEETQKILLQNPELEKVCGHFTNSLKDGAVFYDLDGSELYRVEKSRHNLKKISLLEGDTEIGLVEKKTSFLKNPLSLAERYSVTLRGSLLGILEVDEQKLFKTLAKPDFNTWVYHDCDSPRKVLDVQENVLASIYYPGNHAYIFERQDSFDAVLLILCFLAVRMRREEMSSK